MQFIKNTNSLCHSPEKAASWIKSYSIKCTLLLLAVCAVSAMLISCGKAGDGAKAVHTGVASAAEPLPVSEEEFAQMFEYEYRGEGIAITEYLGDDSVLEIPAYAGTKPITAIDQYAFAGCGFLTTVTIPNGVTDIGYQSFVGCRSLSSVTLPESLKRIDEMAFIYCDKLVSIDIPANVETIGFTAFTDMERFNVSKNNRHYCSVEGVLFSKDMTLLHTYPSMAKDTSYNIPKKVTRIGDGAFLYCESLTTVSMHNGVSDIGKAAFSQCTSLSSIQLPESLVSIGETAFYNCKSLPSFTIPDSVKSIGSGAFTGIDKLFISENNSHYCIVDGVLFSKDMTLLHTYPCGKKEISYTIPSNTIRIGGYAFADNELLSHVTFPTSVVFIEDWAFANCTAVSTLIIPASVTSIGNWVFSHCESLSYITIPSSVTSIGEFPFQYCRDDLVIRCPYGSFVEAYAIDYGIAHEPF